MRSQCQAKLRRVSWSSAVVDNHPPLSQPWLGDALSIAEADVQKLERRVAFESIVVEQLQVTPNVCCHPRFVFVHPPYVAAARPRLRSMLMPLLGWRTTAAHGEGSSCGRRRSAWLRLQKIWPRSGRFARIWQPRLRGEPPRGHLSGSAFAEPQLKIRSALRHLSYRLAVRRRGRPPALPPCLHCQVALEEQHRRSWKSVRAAGSPKSSSEECGIGGAGREAAAAAAGSFALLMQKDQRQRRRLGGARLRTKRSNVYVYVYVCSGINRTMRWAAAATWYSWYRAWQSMGPCGAAR